MKTAACLFPCRLPRMICLLCILSGLVYPAPLITAPSNAERIVPPIERALSTTDSSCIEAALDGAISADNAIANSGSEGCLISVNFPVVTVRVYNKHNIWKEITSPYNLNDVVVTAANIWAKVGFVAPNAYAEYSLRFDAQYDSRIQFFLNGARSEDGYARSGAINLTFTVLDAFGVFAEALDLETLEYLFQAMAQQNALLQAADALASLDIPRFIDSFTKLFSDDEFIALIQYVGAKVGKAITKDLLQTVFTVAKIVFTAKDVVENIWLIATGTFAGTVTFTSIISDNPLPPPPGNPPPKDTSPNPDYDAHRFTGAESPTDSYVAQPGAAVRKSWQVQNTGNTTWGGGYRLVFVSGKQMGAPSEVAVPAAAPGQMVALLLDIVAPSEAGVHRGYWQLRNPQGTFFGDRLWVQVTVPGQSPAPNPNDSRTTLTCLNCLAAMTPGQTYRPTLSATIGDGQLLPGRGDMLRNKDGNLFGGHELLAVDRVVNAGQSIQLTFYENNPLRAPDTPGVYESKWGIWRNGNWYGPELTIRFEVAASGGGNRPPNSPTLTSPHDWAVYTGNGGIVLTTQHNGDPDGDAIAEYYFELSGQQTANSGWISSNSWSPQGLGYYGYQWRVKVRDSRGVESGWSAQTWNFSVQTNEPQIYEFYTTQCRPAWADGTTDRLCFCARTNAGTIKVLVNSATDGSDRGIWDTIYELGSSNFSCSSDSDRPPVWMSELAYESGRHLARLYARRDGGWTSATNRDIVIDLSAARRPNSPSVTLPAWESYTSDRTVLFDWIDTLRTTQYRLQVATDLELNNVLVDQYFPAGTSQYQHTFDADYPNLYGHVTAYGPYGSNTGAIRLKIDRTPPSSTMVALPAVVYETKLPVQWGGSDSQSGLNWYHIQVRDGDRAGSEWQDWLVNTTKTTDIFTGLSGHIYFFRVRAMDKIGNWEEWPADDGDTATLIDPSAAPSTPWWDQAYALKHNLVILNNDADALPAHFPVMLHLDGSTAPTAAEVYAASLAPGSGDDLRIVHNNQTELNRLVYAFSPSSIDILFPLQTGVGGYQSDGTSYQLYIGNAAAGAPPTDMNSIFLPTPDAHTVGLWHFQEGSGETVYDSSGRAHNGSFANAGWGSGLFGRSAYFNGANSTVSLGSHSDFNTLGAFTLEAWIRPARPGWGMVFNKGIDGYGQYGMRITGDTGVECTVGADGGDRAVSSGSALQVNAWSHVACVHDGGSGFWVYVNGRQAGWRSDSRPALIRDYPLYLGNAPYWGGMAFNGSIQNVRISNVARHDFPYAMIDTPPTVAAGNAVAPPIVGNPDLAVQALAVFQDTNGRQIVQAVVQNQGDASTLNDFATDIYVDRIPLGPGDYTGSIQFWVSSPIAAGATVTLTAALPAANVQSLAGVQEAGAPSIAGEGESETNAWLPEVTRTLYVQTDSTGALRESDRSNNITATGLDVCTTVHDQYEPDNTSMQARILESGDVQTHNVGASGDEDWVIIRANAGWMYTVWTSDLGVAADTDLYLYSPDRSQVLAANDDRDGNLSSRIEWTAPATGSYYLRIRHWNPTAQGCGTRYRVHFEHVIWRLQPDLVVDAMSLEDTANTTCVANPSTVQLRVRVRNQGDFAAGLFVVSVNGQRRTVPSLDAGATASLLFDSDGGWEYTAIADVEQQVSESNEDNNQIVQFVPVPTQLPPCETVTATPVTPTPVTPTPVTPTPVTPTPPGQARESLFLPQVRR